MNILFVIPSLMRAGAERLVVNACNELIKDDKNKVAIFLINKQNEYSEELDSRIEIEGGGISFHLSVYKKNSINNANYVQFVQQFKPDVIHSHLYLSDVLSHSFHFEGAKYVSHIHNSEIENYNRLNWNRLNKKKTWTNYYEKSWLTKRYKSFKTQFIACSAGAQKLHEEKIRVGSVSILPNAIPLPDLSSSQKQIKRTLELIWIGRFTQVKRPQLAINIAQALKNAHIDFNLKLAGIGPEFENCKKLISDLNLTDSVHLLGLVDNLSPIYDQAHLMVHTAKFEGLPMVFIEAGAHGIPIITTDCLPQNDIIEEGINGRIIATENEADFVSVISEIANDSKKYGELSDNSVKKSKNFGIEKYAQTLQQLYAK